MGAISDTDTPVALEALRRSILSRWPDDGDARTLSAVIGSKIRRITREN